MEKIGLVTRGSVGRPLRWEEMDSNWQKIVSGLSAIAGGLDALNQRLENVGTSIKRYKDEVATIAELEALPIEQNVEGDGRVVTEDVNSEGQSYTWVWDGSDWSRTPYTTLPADVVRRNTIFNISQASNNYIIDNKPTARGLVPLSGRGKGQIITYRLLNGKWITEKYVGDAPTYWDNDRNWIDENQMLSQSIENIMYRKVDLTQGYINNKLPIIVKEVALKGSFQNKLIGVSQLSWTDATMSKISAFIAEYPDKETKITVTSKNTLCSGVSGVIEENNKGLLKINLTSSTGAYSGYIIIDLSNYDRTTDYLPYNTDLHSYAGRGIKNSKVIDLNRTNDIEVISSLQNSTSVLYCEKTNENVNIVRSAIKDFSLFGKIVDNDKYLVLSRLLFSSDKKILHLAISAFDTATERPTSSASAETMKYIWQNNYTIKETDWNGFATISISNVNNRNILGRIVVDLNALAQSVGLNQNRLANYNESGLIKPRFVKVSSIFQKNAILSLTNLGSFERIAKSFLAIIDTNIANVKNGYYAIRTFQAYTDTDGLRKLWFEICRSTSLTDSLTDANLYAGISKYTISDKSGVQYLALQQRNNNGSNVIVRIDFDALLKVLDYDTVFNHASSNFENCGFDMDLMLSDSIKYNQLNNEQSNGTNFPSVMEAASKKVKGVFAVGNMLMKNKVSEPTTYRDYEPINRTLPMPAKLNIKEVKKLNDNYSKIGLGWVGNDDVFYLYSDKVFYKTDSLDKEVSQFTVLFTADDLGVNRVRYIRTLENNELIMEGVTAEGYSRLFFTENGQTTLKTITVDGLEMSYLPFYEAANVRVETWWGFSQYGDYIILSDYDAARVAGNVWLSKDGGDSFNKVLDLNDMSNVENWQNNSKRARWHVHGCCVDPYWDRLWVITGDDDSDGTTHDNTSIYWSDDWGATWKYRRSTVNQTNRMLQCVSIIPLKNCLVMGSDWHACGYMRINRTTKDEIPQYEYADIKDDIGKLLYYDRQHSYKNGVLLLVQGRDVPNNELADKNSYISATVNGFEFFRLWEDTERKYHSDLAVFQTNDGTVYLSTQRNGSDGNQRNILKFGKFRIEQ